MSKKLGFWSVFALVTSSQIGSGVFINPINLAQFGFYSIAGWVISALGAIMLSLVFAQLCSWFPKTGGPHVYVNEAFGSCASFFTGWTYWVISWVSSTVVVTASIGYLLPVFGIESVFIKLLLQIALIVGITALNLYGVDAAGHAEFVLNLLKIIPLVIVPIAALFYFNVNNFVIDPSISTLSVPTIISRVILITLWGFIGLESATAPAAEVENASKTIPRAVVIGTISVALIYIINSIGIMGIISGPTLMQSNAPYADAAKIIFGGNWHILISLIASCICIGSLIAWTLTSSQIALGLSNDGLMPSVFRIKNKYGVPYWGLIISCLGIIPLLILTSSKNLATQVLTIIDFSVTSFLFVYAISCLSFLKILRKKSGNLFQYFYGIVALIFCSWVIYQTSINTLLIASLFTLSGIPIFLNICSNRKCC